MSYIAMLMLGAAFGMITACLLFAAREGEE
jgi:hypothetical protein